MKLTMVKTLIAATVSLPCITAQALEAMSDEQLSGVNGQGKFNFALENIDFKGEAIPGVAEAGSFNTVAVDGSSLRRENFQFSADSIGTRTSPLSTSTVRLNPTVNSISDGNVTKNGRVLAEQDFLRIDLPDRAGWNNVDIQYDAIYSNPFVVDANNPNIAAGGTPSDKLDFGRITIDNIAVIGSLEISGIPDGYKIESVLLNDGSRGANSREGILLNANIEEISIDQWLFETEQADGIFDADRDMVIKDLSITNLNLKSATFETTSTGYRIAYSDPQPFTHPEGLLIKSGGGFPDVGHAAYDASRPKTNITLTTQMPHGQMSQSRIHGVTLDHLVFNLRN
ncbi:hypothetical protein [Alkalimarinus sediminis]|uniref:Uncharacterized protein n=1 Tax=Alkalimarinus sediminis TaxID=1632866 RepID=A0A9E8HH28_9ALTE|nr:hypothetical protein [Alkalimarinus sediminis]UZW74125.1 hypothetical protein NNL22_13980 [Alkalimarinus sediminis]